MTSHEPQERARSRLSPPKSISALAAIVLLPLLVLASSSATAARDKRPPRIVSAAMADTDRDASADALRLTYSERIKHVRDANGRYPFVVVGYRIRSVGAGSGKSVVIRLVEKAKADTAAKPRVQYRRTSSQPVKDRAGNQAVAQVFRATRPHGAKPTTVPNPTPIPVKDADGDGTDDGRDCAPKDPKIHPGAADAPDLDFVDSNCDGIDGDEKKAIFASPIGNDAAPGTKASPKRQIRVAVTAAAAAGKDVYAATGSYERVSLVSGVSIYGGYDASTWARRGTLVTAIFGDGEGIFADKATGVLLQLLKVTGATSQLKVPPGTSFYGIRAVNRSNLTLQRVSVSARSGEEGAFGARGTPGATGRPGGNGGKGSCDGSTPGAGGAGGISAAGRDGGAGGKGGRDIYGTQGRGGPGLPGTVNTDGGKGGAPGGPRQGRHDRHLRRSGRGRRRRRRRSPHAVERPLLDRPERKERHRRDRRPRRRRRRRRRRPGLHLLQQRLR